MKKLIVYAAAVISLLYARVTFAQIPQVSAMSACVADADTGDVLYVKNADWRLPMASTTKIMTALVVLENCAPDEVVTVSANAAATEGSSAYIKQGDRICVKDLLYGLMLNSGNDAAVALAEHTAGSETEFADMMNKKASELDLKNTSFDNASGLDGETHYTTARELAAITAAAMKNEIFREIVSTKEKTVMLENGGSSLTFVNHNRLLDRYEGAVGVKTGYTKKCGRCLVSAAKRGENTIIAVTLNDSNDWESHEMLLDFGFSCIKEIKAVSSGQIFSEKDGQKYAAASDVYVYAAGEARECEIITHIKKHTGSPLKKGDNAGYAEVMYKGHAMAAVDLVAANDAPAEERTAQRKDGMIVRIIILLKKILGIRK